MNCVKVRRKAYCLDTNFCLITYIIRKQPEATEKFNFKIDTKNIVKKSL